VKLYHRTPDPVAILRDGFRERRGSMDLTGVWLSDYPLDINAGAKGPTVLSIDIPEEEILAFEIIEDEKPYREWCVPADRVNRFGPPTIHDDDFSECTEEEVLLRVKRLRASNIPHLVAEADAIEARLPLLIAHGVLGKEESEEDAEH
jgi:hypothetical protein